jgi:hypothetical protein
MTDRLNELARAITEAEDELNSSNHRDNCQQLAELDSVTRPHLVERIEAREKALDVARDAMRAYAQKLASEGAVKVEIETGEMMTEIIGDHQPDQSSSQSLRANAWDSDPWQVAEPTPLYSNGLDAPQED